MAWLRTLAETYDVYSDLVGVEKNGQAVLLPISHSTFNAQIEVTIDQDGNFQGARKLDKGDDVVTIIPVTEDSATRTRTSDKAPAPHSLCDKLCYIAGDYTLYTGDDKEKYYEAYMAQLRNWVESDYTHSMVQAVYKYLEKKSLIHDLVSSKTLKLDENGRLTDKIKIHGSGQTGANIRFIVWGSSMPQEVWKNQELYRKYSEYYKQRLGEMSLCYISGKIVLCSDKHPYKIRHSGDQAKLISGNDESGFTYRGRFTSKKQAVSVGYDISQKAHLALGWLIQKQGYTQDGSAIVCWMINRDVQLPDIMKDSINACNDIDDFNFNFDMIGSDETLKLKKLDTGKYFAEKFNNAVNGYVRNFKMDDKVAVIALDGADTKKGRISVAFYDEMGGKQYADAILNWQKHCKWRRTVRLEKSEESNKRVTCECTPSPKDMALAAFGIQRSKGLEADGKLIKGTIKRLLPCITRVGVQIPQDLIKAAARSASMPESYKSSKNKGKQYDIWYNDVLCVACAMIRFNYEKGDRTMENFLNDNINDRDILFGRLLAIYDYMEQRAMFEYDENGKVKERRTTNAKRYWNAYCSRPAKTLKTIRQNLIAYEKKLDGYQLMKFEEWTEEIMTHLAGNGFDNTALSEMYLPGYYQQMEYMKKAFQKKEQ